MKQPTTHGGRRQNSGRPPKGSNKRRTVSVCLEPENAEFLAAKGRGKNDYLNMLLERERKAN